MFVKRPYMKYIWDLLSSEDYLRWSLSKPNDKLKILHSALSEKLKEDPDYEVWMCLENFRYDPEEKYVNGGYYRCSYVYVSNKGRIVNIKGRYHPTFGGGMKNPLVRYRYYYHRYSSNERMQFFMHRLVGTVFVPRTGPLETVLPSFLQVNHKDGDRGNNDFRNLEWVTGSENMTHAYETGLVIRESGENNKRSKYALGTVTLEGEFKGFQFVLCGAKEMKNYGIGESSVVACISGRKKLYRNCTWTYVSKEEAQKYTRGVPSELIPILTQTHSSCKHLIIATNVETGELIKMLGNKEIESRGFNLGSLYKCLKTPGMMHKGYTFDTVPIR